MSSSRICPHCGKTIASEIPDGWIKVPLESWNKLVQENEAFEHAVIASGEARRLAIRAKALWEASQIMEMAATELEEIVESLDEEGGKTALGGAASSRAASTSPAPTLSST